MSKKNLWYLLYLSCPQDKLSRPMTRTKSGPTLEHPHWSFHPFGTIQQIILHRFKIWPDIKRTRKPNNKYWHDQVQAETGTQASAKFFRVLQFSGNFLLSFFCCSEGQLPIYLCTTRFTFLHPKQLSPGGTPGKWEWYSPRLKRWPHPGNRKECQNWQTTPTGDLLQLTATSVDKGDAKKDLVCCHGVKQVFHGDALGHPGQRHGVPEPEAQPQHWPRLHSKGRGRGTHIKKPVHVCYYIEQKTI